MATLIKVDGSEIEIHPLNSEQGLLPNEMVCLVGEPLHLICLDKHSVMVVNNETTAPQLKNYRATKVLQFFTGDDQDAVRGPALLVGETEIHYGKLEFGSLWRFLMAALVAHPRTNQTLMPDQEQNPEQVRKALAQQIRNLRIKKAWSQKMLAELSGINLRSISQIEQGEFEVRLSDLFALAEAFHISIYQLIRGIA